MLDLNLIITVVATVAGIVAVGFSWKSVTAAKTTNKIALFADLHQQYHTQRFFQSVQTCWKIYQRLQPSDTGQEPITLAQAREYLNTIDEASEAWQAIHNVNTFWRYVALLIAHKLLDEELAFKAFTSPRILGLIYPIEMAFSEKYSAGEGQPSHSANILKSLYNQFKDYKRKNA